MKLPFNANRELFHKVVIYLYNANTRIAREQILEDIYIPNKSPNEDLGNYLTQSRASLENITRASKTDTGMDHIKVLVGNKGFLQATMINHKSFFEFIKSNKITKYNAKNMEDVDTLVGLYLNDVREYNALPTEQIATQLSYKYGYILGTILPTIGMIRSCYNEYLKNLQNHFGELLQKHFNLLRNGDDAQFKTHVQRDLDGTFPSLDKEMIITYVTKKSNSKNKSK